MSKVLIVGNVIDGLRIIGPFDDTDTACEYATEYETDETWWVADLDTVNDDSDYGDCYDCAYHGTGDSVCKNCSLSEEYSLADIMPAGVGKTYEANFIGEPFHLGLSDYYEGEDFLGYPVYRYTLDFYPTYTQEIVKPENVIDIPAPDVNVGLSDDWTTWPW